MSIVHSGVVFSYTVSHTFELFLMSELLLGRIRIDPFLDIVDLMLDAKIFERHNANNTAHKKERNNNSCKKGKGT